MKRIRLYIGLFFLLAVFRTGFGQTTENYVRSYRARTANTSPSAVTSGDNSVSYKSFTYFDGLGRPLQTVQKQGTINSRDLITPIDYDAYGRQTKEYLPYFETGGTQDGRFRASGIADQTARTSPIYGDTYGYSEKQYEESPLNRVDKQGAPGAAWRLTTGKEVKFFRRTNTADDGVRVFTVNGTGLPVSSSAYVVNELWVEIVDDEDNKRMVQYTDKLGRLVMKKVQNTATPAGIGHTGWLCTYYVYDDLGQLRVVIPPKAVEEIAAASWTSASSTNTTRADGLYFRYSYDSRGRMSEKRVPGKAVEYMLYDSQDRLVGFQDGNLRASNKWLYTKYDALDRVLVTGITVDATAFATLQTNLASGSNNAAVNGNTANVKTGATISSAKYDGYSEYVASSTITLQNGFNFSANGDRTFTARIGTASTGAAGAWPTEEGEILTVNYYDSYQFMSGFSYVVPPTGTYPGFEAKASTRTHGLQTGKKVKNLDTGEFYTTAIFYDNKGRVIQTLAQQLYGGYIRTTTEYNFEGQPKQMLVANNSAVGQEVLRTYTYNIAGLLATVSHKIGGQAAKTIAQNTYNDLGQLISKSFPEITNGNQTYTYNIRGWLKTLGSSLTQGYKQTNYYETGATANNWNGNISRIDWTGRDGTAKVRTYNYAYDKVNRITAGTYSATGETNWFTVNGITYDGNGNPTKLVRQNQQTASTYGVVDNLTYTYQTSSNRLNQVADAATALTYTSKDFKERGTPAYGYDANGNLTSSLDKQISAITYNHLNLPAQVTFNTGAYLVFSYDAEGNKLRQKTYNTSGALTKTQDYIGEFAYLDGALDYLIHEEGRVAIELGTYQYEYYLKDHLGNVRQVLRNPSTQVYTATMETQFAETEEQEFTQVMATRQTEPEHNKTEGGSKVAWLNAERGRMVGPGRSQEIYAGDSLKLQVYGKYLDDKKQKVNAGSFVSQGAKERLLTDLNELATSTQRAGGGNPIALFNLANILAGDFQKKETPEAYLIYALYDQDSNRYEVGKKVLSKNAANQHEVLEENMYIAKDGYVETFLVNETSEDVWFDNFMVMSMTDPIAQETHYDPWGLELTGIGYQYGGIKANKYLYNGKELLDDQNFNIYDFHARGYDPVIGRTLQIDPMADSYYPWSPYAWTMNNPLKYMDPTGMFSTHTDEEGNVVAVYDDGDLGVYRHEGSKSEAAENVKRNYSEDNKGAGGVRMGESLHALSFADQSLYNETGVVKEARIKIDFGSSDLTNRVQEILNSDPSLFDYFKKAGGGGDWDIKAHVSNGSKLYGKYASPRDAGNFAAGAVAQKSGLAPLAQFGYGAYNLSGNNKYIMGAMTGVVGWMTLANRPIGLASAYLIGKYGEDKLSQRSIDIGKDFIRRK